MHGQRTWLSRHPNDKHTFIPPYSVCSLIHQLLNSPFLNVKAVILLFHIYVCVYAHAYIRVALWSLLRAAFRLLTMVFRIEVPLVWWNYLFLKDAVVLLDCTLHSWWSVWGQAAFRAAVSKTSKLRNMVFWPFLVDIAKGKAYSHELLAIFPLPTAAKPKL